MRLAASVLVSGDYDFRRSDLTTMDLGARAAQRAYEQAGVGPDDVNVVELHDAFASEEIIHAEDLGLCARGDGVGLLRSGPPRSVAASPPLALCPTASGAVPGAFPADWPSQARAAMSRHPRLRVE